MQNHREAMDAAMSNPISTNATDLLAEFIGGSIELFGANPDDLSAIRELEDRRLVIATGTDPIYLSLTADGADLVDDMRADILEGRVKR
jgi:hypothetical protein